MKSLFVKILIAIVLSLAFHGVLFSQTCSEPGSIARIKNRSAGKFEYVIFDIIKDSTSTYTPDYSVSTASPPFKGYSEDEGDILVKGERFKQVVFRSVFWMCHTSNQFSRKSGAVADVELLYSFEGISEFAVGYRRRSRYMGSYHYDAGSVKKVVIKFRK